MKKIKIGIPHAFIYYKYHVLWKEFFNRIGCRVVTSPETNNEIINISKDLKNINLCLSLKIYLGHVIYLEKISDYILVVKSSSKKCYCPIINNVINSIKENVSSNQQIKIPIENNSIISEFITYLMIGLKICNNPIRIISSYIYAKKKQIKYENNKINEERNKLINEKYKVLIVSNIYDISDKYISKYILDYLKYKNINPIYSYNIDKKIARTLATYESNLNIRDREELLGAYNYYKYQIDGMIFIDSEDCKINNSIYKYLMERDKSIPSIKITITKDQNKEFVLKEIDKLYLKLVNINNR